MATLVALHAHPDDESSKGAATVARYSDDGVRCVLVTATGGEAGDILNPAMDRPEVKQRIGEIRLAELQRAAGVIGYDEVVLLGYRDSGMAGTPENDNPEAFVNVDFDRAVERVVRIIRHERPQVLLGYDHHAWYPHPDHIRIHEISVEAFEAAADPSRFIDSGDPWAPAKLYAPIFTPERMAALHGAMLARGLDSPYGEWMERFEQADNPHLVSSVDVSSTIERGRDALRAHRTQVDPDGFWFQVPAEVIREIYPYEDFALLASRVTVSGPEDDLFAGIEA